MTQVELMLGQNPEMQEVAESNLLKKDLQKAIENFYALPLSKNGDSHAHSRGEIREVVERAWEPIARNNLISEIFNSEPFQEIIERKNKLKGSTSLAAIWCVDGRLDGMSLGVLVNLWENPAGVIDTDETSDGGLRPRSTELCEHIRDDADSGTDLLEIVFAHYDSTNPHHGCAANAAILAQIRAHRRPENAGKLSFDDLSAINHTPNAEDANLIFIKGTSVRAITDYYNKVRSNAGLEPLPIVAVAALYDTATMGIVLRENAHPDLSTAKLANKYKKEIAANTNAVFASFRDNFTDPQNLVEFSDKIVTISETLLDPSSKLAPFNSELDKYIREVYPQLTSDQAQALKFLIAKTVSFQYLTGLSEIPASGPNHLFANHAEGYMGLSVRGEFIGKYDTKQAFGSTAADAPTATDQIKIELGVMEKTGIDADKPRLIFISNSISKDAFKNDKKARKRAAGNNAKISSEIIADPEINRLIRNNKLVFIHTLIDDTTGGVLSILDHSTYY
jgi:hypothetical protein